MYSVTDSKAAAIKKKKWSEGIGKGERNNPEKAKETQTTLNKLAKKEKKKL